MSGLGYSNAKSVRMSHIELSETKSKNPENYFHVILVSYFEVNIVSKLFFQNCCPRDLPLLGSTYFCTKGSINDNPNLVPACWTRYVMRLNVLCFKFILSENSVLIIGTYAKGIGV